MPRAQDLRAVEVNLRSLHNSANAQRHALAVPIFGNVEDLAVVARSDQVGKVGERWIVQIAHRKVHLPISRIELRPEPPACVLKP